MLYKSILAVTLTTFYATVIEAKIRNDTRCFQFTWLGPKHHNGSAFSNETCGNTKAGIPCEYPLIASYDGTWPDVKYLWNHHAEQVTCLLSDSEVCARFTYYFNGQAENSTYMCTRAIDSNNTVVPLGCYQSVNGSSSIRVCLCRTTPGSSPCNSATTHYSMSVVTTVTFVLLLISTRLSSTA